MSNFQTSSSFHPMSSFLNLAVISIFSNSSRLYHIELQSHVSAINPDTRCGVVAEYMSSLTDSESRLTHLCSSLETNRSPSWCRNRCAEYARRLKKTLVHRLQRIMSLREGQTGGGHTQTWTRADG